MNADMSHTSEYVDEMFAQEQARMQSEPQSEKTVSIQDAPEYVENIVREEEARRQQEKAAEEARRQQAEEEALRSLVENETKDLNDRALAMIPLDEIKKEAENEAKRKHWIRNLVSKVPFAKKSKNLMKFYIGNEIDQRVEKEIEKAKEAIKEVEGTFKSQRDQVQTEREVEAQEQKQAETSSSRQQRNEFIKGLSNFDVMDIAEKGIDGIEAEKRDAHNSELHEKREAFKKAAHERETDKFGKSYADKSYKANDSGDER